MNIVIPMAGMGSRFADAGYKDPKPFIDVMGKPMIKVVYDNFDITGHYIFITQKFHNKKYDVKNSVLDHISGNKSGKIDIVEIEGITEGAACTVLKAREYIDNDEELVILNSDQIVLDYSYAYEGIKFFRKNNMDGGIWCFLCKDPKWSYAEIDSKGLVTRVVEKEPISDIATVGSYYFKRGSDFVKSADSMISKDIRVKNEFYTCPTYNELISSGGRVGVYMVNEMVGLGTPEDLNRYIHSCS